MPFMHKNSYNVSCLLCCKSLSIVAKLYLGKLKYVHVIVYTYSLLLSGETVKNVTNFLLRAFDTLGPCKILKTNNGLTHTTKPFQEICQQYAVCGKREWTT